MSASICLGRSRRRALLLCGAALGCAAALPGGAWAASVSANWAGYVALPRATGQSFRSVSGTWTQPSVTCTAGREDYSAVWVGLGGYREDSKALEQIGTEADCTRDGQARYTTWYELIPAAPVTLSVKITPGDEMAASVTVGGHDVTLRLRDLTSGVRYSLTRPASVLDASSADWILEAPSTCLTEGSCQTLPLSNFDSVSFTSATATLGARTAPVASPYWSDVALELRQGSGGGGFGSWRHARAESGAALIAATPSGLSGEGGFSVQWQEQPLQSEGPPVPHFFKTRGGS
jgi:Peptidase A4 family